MAHTFHIPVMGTGFTIDTPIKVSQFGINSVISLVDDILMEKLRKVYCEKSGLPYQEITNKVADFRAKRITSYLNLVNDLAQEKFEKLKSSINEKGNEIKDYISMLPSGSELRETFKNVTSASIDVNEIISEIKNSLFQGTIDVNIMTKLDKENYIKNEQLPTEFNDAHAALRGYANSDLESSIILSAGVNTRLYSYFSQFTDFYPNEDGYIKKKIVLKVSDYTSALIQGKFLAKRGLWVSEYRVESGLNCGGHAFATQGLLMGPILEKFKENREVLIDSVHEVFIKTLKDENKTIPKSKLPIKITTQGGVGTAEEHDFLLKHYEVDSVGWGTPFLLVEEATTVDKPTRELLRKAGEKDLYLSDISPLGVPFNSLAGNTKDLKKLELVSQGKPGSNCPKQFLVSNTDYSEKKICTASRRYQKIKIDELKKEEVSAEEYHSKFDKIIEKACICVGLGTSALLENNLDTKIEGSEVSVCPGPNMAYFSKMMSLKEITDHIYGRAGFSLNKRPNMFIKELKIYVDFLKEKIQKERVNTTKKQKKQLVDFVKNLNEAVSYYNNMFTNLKETFKSTKTRIISDLETYKNKIGILNSEIDKL